MLDLLKMSFYDPNRKSTTSGMTLVNIFYFGRGLIKQIHVIQVLFRGFCEIFKSMIRFRLTNIFIILYIHIWFDIYIYILYVLNRTWDGWLR